MRVGLLTYHWVPNFGAQLQTLSTYKYLERNQYDPLIINWVPNDTKKYYERIVEFAQREKHADFLRNNCQMTEEFSKSDDFSVVLEKNGITHVVIGSDSLFNIAKPKFDLCKRKRTTPSEDHTFPNPFWGKGFEELPHIGLSISSQNAKFTDFKDERDITSEILKRFRVVTVRDKWTQTMVSYLSKGAIEPTVTPDPVFGFNSNVSTVMTKDEILSKFNLPEKYVLLSFTSGRMRAKQEWLDSITRMFHEEGYCCVMLPMLAGGQTMHLDISIPLPLSPIDWYYLIKYSSGYIGVLMHPIVVSLHNAVPFFSFDHYGSGPYFLTRKKSSKIYDILERADLLQCHFMTRNHLTFPSAEKVFRCILDFPKEKCRHFAEIQQERCLSNMDNLLHELTK